jgi:hypothetical protein
MIFSLVRILIHPICCIPCASVNFLSVVHQGQMSILLVSTGPWFLLGPGCQMHDSWRKYKYNDEGHCICFYFTAHFNSNGALFHKNELKIYISSHICYLSNIRKSLLNRDYSMIIPAKWVFKGRKIEAKSEMYLYIWLYCFKHQINTFS